MIRILLILAILLTFGEAEAQTVRISDGVDNAQVTTTAGGSLQVECAAGCATATNAVGATVTFNDVTDVAFVALEGRNGAIVDIASGTCETDVVVEVSTNNQASWVPAVVGDSSTGLVLPEISLTNPNGAVSRTILYPGSITHARAKPGATITGACDVTLRAVTTSPVAFVHGADLAGSGAKILPFMSTTPSGTEMAPLFRCIGCTSTGGTNAADNTVWVYGTTGVTPIGFVYDTTPTAPTDGNVGVARMNANRDAHSLLVGPDGLPAVETTNGVKVTLTTVASTQGYNRRVNSPVAAGLSLTIDGNGAGTVMWSVAGAFTGTLVFEGTLDPGGSPVYERTQAVLKDTGQIIRTLTNPTGAVSGYFRQTGFRKFQVRIDTHSSGTPDLRLELANPSSGIDPTAINCTETAVFNTSAATTPVQVIAGVTGENIYICGVDISADGTTTAKFVDGTSSSCASSTDISGTHRLTAQAGWTRDASRGSIVYKTSAAGRFICISTGGSIQIDGTVNYARF